MKNNNQWIDSRSPEAVTYAANIWKIGKPETWGRLDRAVGAEELSPNLPFLEFKEYVESQITCPVCRVATPIDATNCPSCKVDLQIARKQFDVGPKPKTSEHQNTVQNDFTSLLKLISLSIGVVALIYMVIIAFVNIDSITNIDFLMGLASIGLSLLLLYHTYFTGKIRPTFRAHLFIWLLLLAGLSFTFGVK